jgi:hypothetical protein
MKQRIPVVLAAALALLALVETASALLAPLRVARPADWDAAAAEVRAHFRDGDLIAFAPYWADQVGRAHFEMVTVDMAGRADSERYSRVWEVSIRGAHSPDATGRLISKKAFGRVEVALWEKPAAEIVYDFTTHADEARVTVGDERGEQPCLRDVGSGFRCPGSRVERRTLEIDYRPRRGILIPLEVARATRIAFDDIELGAKLVGYTGLHDYYARKNADGPVQLRVFIDGVERANFMTRNSDDWRRFELDTQPGRHAVRFEISSPSPAWRNLGLHVEARK